MKYIISFLIISFLYAGKCGDNKTTSDKGKKEQLKDSIPACVQKLINDSKKETPPNAPIKIDEYLYKGKKVYFFTAQCCDQFNDLYDDSCRRICAPSGGFTGRGDGKCTDFDSTAKHVKLIWKNPIK